MKVEFDTTSFVMTEQLKEHVQGRLALALGALAPRVRGIVVRLTDALPGTGRPHKRCQLEVTLRPLAVRAEEVDTDLYAAVDKAADRLRRAVSRALAHEKAWSETPPPPTEGAPSAGSGTVGPRSSKKQP